MWEPRKYHELPAWVRAASDPQKIPIPKDTTRYFHGRHYVYRVEYTRDEKGHLHIRNWRRKRISASMMGFIRYYRPFIRVCLIIVCLLCISLFIPWNDLTQAIGDAYNPSTTFNTSPVAHTYPYGYDGRDSLTFTTYGGFSEYLGQEDHSYQYSFEDEVIGDLLGNKYQEQYLASLIDALRRTSPSPERQAKNAIGMVQHIPYFWDRFNDPADTDWYYPYETLHHMRGVCADKSLLLAYLLDKLGYDVVLFDWNRDKGGHMAVGVRCTGGYDYAGSGYAFIESTGPNIPTYVPDTYIGGLVLTPDPSIIHVSESGKALDLSEEYRDAGELQKLESMGQVLDSYHYGRWQALNRKYDLEYET
jgi:hypothetical protein